MAVRKCPICGKEFTLAPCHIYKATVNGRVKPLCSYSCVRKLEKEREAKKKPKEDY